jgi:hypothetical protein
MQTGLQIQIDTTQAGAAAGPSLTINVQQVLAGLVAQTLSTTQLALSNPVAPNPPPQTPPQTPCSQWLATFPKDVDGYSLFPVPPGAVVVGTQPGDSPDLKTAQAAARANGSNCVLLRRGATYPESIINDLWRAGGTPSQPAILGAIGDLSLPRPIIQGMLQLGDANVPLHYLVIDGIDFYDSAADPGSSTYAKKGSQYEAGVRLVTSRPDTQFIGFQDCRFRFMQGGLELQAIGSAPITSVFVKRCEIDHNYGQHWGMYVLRVDDLLLQDVFADHNGWDDAGVLAKMDQNHNLYFQEFLPTAGFPPPKYLPTVQGLFSSRAAADGFEFRLGGLLDGSYLFANPIAGFIGARPSTVSNTVIDGGSGQFDLSCGVTGSRGWGFSSNVCPTVAFTNVLHIAKPDKVNSFSAIYLQTDSTGQNPSVATAATLTNCIVNNWTGLSYQIDGNPPAPVTTFINCDLPGIAAPGVIPTPAYADATRCLATYSTTLAATKVDGAPIVNSPLTFLAAAALNRRGAYDSRLSAEAAQLWVAAGFAVK